MQLSAVSAERPVTDNRAVSIYIAGVRPSEHVGDSLG